MKLSKITTVVASLLVSVLWSSPGFSHSEWEDSSEPLLAQAVAVLHRGTAHEVVGKVYLRAAGDSITIRAELGGLVPAQRYRLQVHEYGDCSEATVDGAEGVGEVFGTSEGLIEFVAGEDGWVDLAFSYRGHTLAYGPTSVVGRSIVVHASHKRVGCGTIGVVTPREAPPHSPEDSG